MFTHHDVIWSVDSIAPREGESIHFIHRYQIRGPPQIWGSLLAIRPLLLRPGGLDGRSFAFRCHLSFRNFFDVILNWYLWATHQNFNFVSKLKINLPVYNKQRTVPAVLLTWSFVAQPELLEQRLGEAMLWLSCDVPLIRDFIFSSHPYGAMRSSLSTTDAIDFISIAFNVIHRV